MEEMTIEELLGEDATEAAVQEAPRASPRAASAPVKAPRNADTAKSSQPAQPVVKVPVERTSTSRKTDKKRYHDMTLDELLDGAEQDELGRAPGCGGSGSPKLAETKPNAKAGKGKQSSTPPSKGSPQPGPTPPSRTQRTQPQRTQRTRQAQQPSQHTQRTKRTEHASPAPRPKRADEMTLEELLDSKPLDGPGMGAGSRQTGPDAEMQHHDLMLDEFLDGADSGDAAGTARGASLAAGSLPVGGGGRSSQGADRFFGEPDDAVDEVTLDELLGPSPGETRADSTSSGAPGRVGAGRGDSDSSGSSTDSGGVGASGRRSDTPGNGARDFEDMSLDELLALDDPFGPQPPVDYGGTKVKDPRKAGKRKKQKQRDGAARQSPPPKASAPPASPKSPRVRVRYEDELTLDEL